MLFAHAVGDYILQSHYMATRKTNSSIACLAHVFTYTLPFLLLTTSWKALLFIAGTHYIIDHWRLARYVCWFKNFLAPKVRVLTKIPENVDGVVGFRDVTVEQWGFPWYECSATGYHNEVPIWLSTWLLIIADNIIHVAMNAAALRWM